MLGCTNPLAINYNPSATQEDYSCVYALPDHLGQPQPFHDVSEFKDSSFTLSYSVESKGWAFFHDYIADFYFHTREQLWSVKDKYIYKHNTGPVGVYYDNEPKSFFVDIVFRSDSDLLLETVNWITEVITAGNDNSVMEAEFETITHVSIWNSQQHTGRIALTDVFEQLQYKTHRRTQGEWSFNDFRNVLADRGVQFLMDIFHDYTLRPETVGIKGWYNMELMEDKYFVVRFEHDNKTGKQLVLHQTNIQALKSDR